MKNNVKLTIAYDGTAYAGWQCQPDQLSIQELIENALLRLTQETVRIHSSGRTDRGVHAKAQVAHFETNSPIPVSNMRRALNAILPRDVRIMQAVKVPNEFHARFSAKSKEYRYFIANTQVLTPFERNYRLHIRKKLNLPAMRVAAAVLTGEHDFAAFTANPNRVVETTVRHLMALEVKKQGTQITIRAVGNGFLYKMVRSLAGGLIRVGTGELTPEDIRLILESKERTAVIPTALPQGLFLWKVNYH